MQRYSFLALARNALTGHRNWQAAWRSPPLRDRYDVLVIGAGGHGLAAAWHLARDHGIRNVAVLERGWLGGGNVARNTVTNPKFPGFEKVGAEYSFHEEWYSLKDFSPDIHVLSVMDAPAMKGDEYKRPAFPSTWARKEGDGRVWYTAMGHREDIWTNPVFQDILIGGIRWALGEVQAEVPANLKETAPGAYTNPPYVEPKAPAPAKPKAK